MHISGFYKCILPLSPNICNYSIRVSTEEIKSFFLISHYKILLLKVLLALMQFNLSCYFLTYWVWTLGLC